MRFRTTLFLSIGLFFITFFPGCKKSDTASTINVSYQMLANKTWYLDYKKAGTKTKTYIGQPTYVINFLKNLTTSDSDGMTGTYTVELINNELQIHVQAKTPKENSIEYIYTIESIGVKNLILSHVLNTDSTTLYFSTK